MRMQAISAAVLKAVRRAQDTVRTAIQNVGVYHRRAHSGVPEEFLNRADVVAILQEGAALQTRRLP